MELSQVDKFNPDNIPVATTRPSEASGISIYAKPITSVRRTYYSYLIIY